jgi:DNA-binding response OmpR family regulator
MEAYSVVLAEKDPTVARSLGSSLDALCRAVKIVHSFDELKSAILRTRADAIIVDLETVSLNSVASLSREFPLPVVCIHRVPDDSLWTAAMEAGAVDVCENYDVSGMIRAITQSRQGIQAA